MSGRPTKRRRINHTVCQANPFIDTEAQVDSDGDEEEEEETQEKDDGILDEDEQYADSVVSHTQLHRVLQDEGLNEWSSFLDRARSAASRLYRGCDRTFLEETIRRSENVQAGGEGQSDFLWEIGCRVGQEEVLAYRILMCYATNEHPLRTPRSIIARASIPGRIHVEVDTREEARRMASFTDLFSSVLRQVPIEERMNILDSTSSRFKAGSWARVRGKKKAWRSYKGDTGFVNVVHRKKCLFLIPRLPTSEDESQTPQNCVPQEEVIARYGREEVEGGESEFLFRGQRYIKEGFLVVDFDDIDVIPRTDVLPTSHELDLFRTCPLVKQEIIQETSARILHALLKPGDRVRIVAGDYLGLSGKVIEVFEHEVEINIPSQDTSERVARSAVRAAFRVGDEVKVVEGPESGFVGWVVEVVQDGLHVCDVQSEKEVSAKFAQVRFYCAPYLAAIHRPRKRANNKIGPKDPNAIYIGKYVAVIGAHEYKGYRGLIKGTSPDGLAWVELEACQQRVEQMSLSDLAIQPRPEAGSLSRIQTHEHLSHAWVSRIPVTSLPAPLPLPEIPSTPMPPPEPFLVSPAWDPSSRTPLRPDHWLEDPCLAGVRVKLRVPGYPNIMEFWGVLGNNARVRDGPTKKLIDLNAVESVPPTEKDDLVTVLIGEMKGKVLKVRKLSGEDCFVRIPGRKPRKYEQDPSFPISAVIHVFPAFR